MKSNESTKPTFFENRKFLPNEFAKYLIDESGEYFVTPRDTEVIHRYENGVYRPNGSPHIKEMVESAVDGKSITGKSVSEVLGHIQRRTYIDRDEFDTGDDDILLKNGILDTETFEFSEHDPHKYFLLQVPVKYDPDAVCQKFKKFLDDLFPIKIENDTLI